MDDVGIGRLFRALRLRLGWRQLDVSEKAGVSRAVYSDMERGHFDRIPLWTLRRVATVLEVRLPLEPSWRGGRIERVISGRHAAMAERLTAMLAAAGWEVRPEASFNSFGERGVVDLVAWHPVCRTLLLIEIKTELVDPSGLLTVTDRRRRLAGVIARDSGWKPGVVAQWVVIAAGRTNARRVAEHRSMLRAAFPADGRSIEAWLADPRKPLDALWFLPDVAHRSTGRAARGPNRVPTRSATASRG
jgi:transcriptional regulator with XRE-family HTH domain